MKMILKNKQSVYISSDKIIFKKTKVNYFDGPTVKLNLIEQRRTWITKVWHAHAVTYPADW